MIPSNQPVAWCTSHRIVEPHRHIVKTHEAFDIKYTRQRPLVHRGADPDTALRRNFITR